MKKKNKRRRKKQKERTKSRKVGENTMTGGGRKNHKRLKKRGKFETLGGQAELQRHFVSSA